MQEFSNQKKKAKLELKEAKKSVKNEQAFQQTLTQKQNTIFLTDCTIDTDLELLIPDSYISQTSEKIRLYKELDAITKQEQLDKFIENLKDRFGELPQQLLQLTYIVRLRWQAIELGFERIVLKNGKMLVYFISNQQSAYYSTNIFSSIMNFINNNHKSMLVKENNKKLLLTISYISTVEDAYNIVVKIKNYIFANL
jgi:Transcription-repair coupling factor (superfamily II helicase)